MFRETQIGYFIRSRPGSPDASDGTGGQMWIKKSFRPRKDTAALTLNIVENEDLIDQKISELETLVIERELEAMLDEDWWMNYK